ncbi:hypothetical protein OSTOST_16058 [Ostertagia ostertagi]
MHLKKYLGEKTFHGYLPEGKRWIRAMNVNVISRLNAAIRWRCAVNCRRVHASVTLRSQELGDDGLPKDYKIRTLKAGSRRLDTFVNRASGKSKTPQEESSGGILKILIRMSCSKAH